MNQEKKKEAKVGEWNVAVLILSKSASVRSTHTCSSRLILSMSLWSWKYHSAYGWAWSPKVTHLASHREGLHQKSLTLENYLAFLQLTCHSKEDIASLPSLDNQSAFRAGTDKRHSLPFCYRNSIVSPTLFLFISSRSNDFFYRSEMAYCMGLLQDIF